MNRSVRTGIAVGGLLLAFAVVAAQVAAMPATAAPAPAAEPDVVTTIRWCGEEQSGNRTLANELKRRERELDDREHSFSARQQGLADAEKRLDARIAALTKLRNELQGNVAEADDARELRVKALVKMVESNRAAAIAPMVSQLEEPLAVEVLDRMNRVKAGKLLAALAPAKAASLAGKLTRPLQADIP